MSTPNKMLERIAEEASDNLKFLISENSEEIQAAMVQVAQAAQETGDPIKFALSFKIACDLYESSVKHTLSWSVRHVREADAEMPDPDQPELFPKRDKAIEALKGGKP